MGDVATAVCSSAACPSLPPRSPLSPLKGRPQPWRVHSEWAQPRQTLQFASHKCRIPAHCFALASQIRHHSVKSRQKENLNLGRLQHARFLFRLRVSASASDLHEESGENVDATCSRPSNATQDSSNEASPPTERYVAAQTNFNVMPFLEKGGQQSTSDMQYMDMTKEVLTTRKQYRDMGTNGQEADMGTDAPQRSLEEDYGLLKEQVEADRIIQLARKPGSETESKPLKRSKIIAKQVISQSSALVIGFVSQLWFEVVALEVRPSLLSGEIERVFLADVCQIGDVVLVKDESAVENEMTAVDCETLGGYDIVTEDGNYIGKIRDYSFDLHNGKLTSLEFDSVGFSLVPSSLISTYRLDVEDVMEVLPDSILVKGGAESRIRRLTKGFWQLPNAGERRRGQKLARSRMQKRRFSEGMDMAGQARPLPSSFRPRYFEGADFEGGDGSEERMDRRSLPKDYGGSSRYRSR